MSWQEYVNTSLVGSGHISKGAIYSKAGDSKWASSEGFECSPEELKEIINGLGGSLDKIYAEGLHVARERYVLTTATKDRSLYARKGKEGIVIVQTSQAILIGQYTESMIAGNSATTIETLADYLIKSGY